MESIKLISCTGCSSERSIELYSTNPRTLELYKTCNICREKKRFKPCDHSICGGEIKCIRCNECKSKCDFGIKANGEHYTKCKVCLHWYHVMNNTEKSNESHKQYNKDNRETINIQNQHKRKELRKDKCKQNLGLTWCDCGGYYGIKTKRCGHNKSKRHIKFFETH